MRPRPTQRPTNVRYYAANRQRGIARVRLRQDRTTAFLRALREVPCADCGGSFAGHPMDFDHRDPRQRSFELLKGRARHSRTGSSSWPRPRSAMSSVPTAIGFGLASATANGWHRGRRPHPLESRIAGGTGDTTRISSISSGRLRALICGGRFAQCAMDFDHRDPSTKVRGVTRMINGSTDRMLAEAAKCDIVCANCHRLRTFRRRSRQTA